VIAQPRTWMDVVAAPVKSPLAILISNLVASVLQADKTPSFSNRWIGAWNQPLQGPTFSAGVDVSSKLGAVFAAALVNASNCRRETHAPQDHRAPKSRSSPDNDCHRAPQEMAPSTFNRQNEGIASDSNKAREMRVYYR